MGKKFSKDYQPKNRKGGRRKKLSTVIKEQGAEAFLSAEQLVTLKAMKKRFGGGKLEISQDQWQNIMVGMSELSREEIVEIINNPETPIGISIIAKSLFVAGNKGNPDNFLAFFARAYGKEKENVHNTGSIAVTEEKKEYTEEELVKMAEERGLPTDIFQKKRNAQPIDSK